MKINYPLLALAIGAFGIGTTEFSPIGLGCPSLRAVWMSRFPLPEC